MQKNKQKNSKCEKKLNEICKNENKGITLIILVITIIILIILSSVTISVVVGDGGFIEQAQGVKNSTQGSIRDEENKTNMILEEYANLMAGQGEIANPDEPIPDTGNAGIDGVLPISPSVADGMIPVKYVESIGWVKTTKSDKAWYDYGSKKWANVVLSEAKWTTSGESQVLNENEPYSMLVWIPRYAYQITSQYHQAGTGGGNINIKFVDTKNQTKDKKETIGMSYPGYVTGTGMTSYVVHPAFSYGDNNGTKTELAGFWVGKFETSNQSCTTIETSGTYDGTGRTVMIKGGVTSWRSISVSNIHTVCTELNKNGNIYGLSNLDSQVDPHMMKNSEWGAVAYLSQNATYGVGDQITINNSSSFITGEGNYRNNISQSTNGNVTGIYDINGGAWEYVAAYIGEGNSYGTKLVNADIKYKDVYSSYDYNTSAPSSGHYGDAVYETSNIGTGASSWYDDYSTFPSITSAFFTRGGSYGNGNMSGVFNFHSGNGIAARLGSFRITISGLK